MDFFDILVKYDKAKEECTITPGFKIYESKDYLTRSGKFYAIWDQENGMWTQNEFRCRELIDKELWEKADEIKKSRPGWTVSVKSLKAYDSKSWKKLITYTQDSPENFIQLDSQLTFADEKVTKEDYRSKRLNYGINHDPCPAYEEIIGTLYSEDERQKLEWAIGSVVAGASKDIQKFVVLYGDIGTGKSTVINIIRKMFNGYVETFDAKALGDSKDQFSMEILKDNPIVAIQHDGDLSRLDDNTKLNSIIAHEDMVINVKNAKHFTTRFNTFLFLGTNKPVKITDSKSGLIRRMIDVSPTGNRLPAQRYEALFSRIDFELGAIAGHCLDVYRKLGKNFYRDYRPIRMIVETDFFFNFMEECFPQFSEQDGTTIKSAYAMYKQFCDEYNGKKLPYNNFKSELATYFNKFYQVTRINGKQVRSWYSGLKREKFNLGTHSVETQMRGWLEFESIPSLLDKELADCKAQLAVSMDDGGDRPEFKWENCRTTLKDIHTDRLHYVKVPVNHIVVDFDLKDESGEKAYELNLEAANKWPPTYAELSKSGKGIHLHYLYTGDPEELSSVYSKDIEVKVFKNNASLRRRVTQCNDIPIALISSGLPLRGEKKTINFDVVKNENALRAMIEKALRREVHANTKPTIDYIKMILDEAYEKNPHYDVSDLESKVIAFANGSTHNSAYCLKVCTEMHFKSDDESQPSEDYESDDLVFFDCEVFPNLLLVNWKYAGKDKAVVRMINPSSSEIERLLKMKLIGFNCRRYDNHILYARYIGKSIEEIYHLSTNIIKGDKNAFFKEAWNLSYTDVYDFCAKKQSLKKWEIDLGIHHQELGMKWDEPVPESDWVKVAEYCDNDVIATEAVFEANKSDFDARLILVNICKALGMNATANDTTNSLTTKIILRGDKDANKKFIYPDLSKLFPGYEFSPYGIPRERYTGKYVNGKSIYLGEDPSEGGRAIGYPGIYYNVITFDVASMHPSSIIAENGFGPYTENFKMLLDIRLAIKHKEYDKIRELFNGALAPYLEDESLAGALSKALKIAINSVYGLTSANFENALRDPHNKDNWVAKRGALFMIKLEQEVKARGGTVVHIKTDSIKLENPTEELKQFVLDFGKQYGYTFEVEAEYSRICLVNDAVYIARKAKWCWSKKEHDEEHNGWTATGAQFQMPYVFKKLFTHEAIGFDDLCETKSTDTALYLDKNESCPDVTEVEEKLKKNSKLFRDNEKQYEIATTELRLLDLKDTAEDQARRDDLQRLTDALTKEAAELEKEDEELYAALEKGHNYCFVGKTGKFTPVISGIGGGHLYRITKEGKYVSVPGTKKPHKIKPGEDPLYRWLESEIVETLGLQSRIDESYYAQFVDAAKDAVSKYGDFEEFTSV